jgi:general stress protein YciG
VKERLGFSFVTLSRGATNRRRDMPNQGGTHEQHVKAGQQSHKNDENRSRQQQAEQGENRQQGGHRGGSGNFAEDRERASEAGRKGGQH